MAPHPCLSRATFRRYERLHHPSEFRRVFQQGRRIAGRRVVVFGWRRSIEVVVRPRVARLGMVVSRRYGAAVQRNRIKRLIREVFRLNKQCLQQDVDVVVVPKIAPPVDFKAFQQELVTLWKQAGIVRTSPGLAD